MDWTGRLEPRGLVPGLSSKGDGRGPAALVEAIAKAEARIKLIDAELRQLAAFPALAETT